MNNQDSPESSTGIRTYEELAGLEGRTVSTAQVQNFSGKWEKLDDKEYPRNLGILRSGTNCYFIQLQTADGRSKGVHTITPADFEARELMLED